MKRFGQPMLLMLLIYILMGTGVVREALPLASAESRERVAEERSRRITGVITQVDAQAKTVTVKTKKEEATLTLSDTTKIVSGKEEKKFSDLKSGDIVTALAKEENGKMIAESIRISTSKIPGDAP